MQRKIAIIDLGPNTTRLVILAYRPGVSFQLIDQVRERVRLSEGMGAENTLRAAESGLATARPQQRRRDLLRLPWCDQQPVDQERLDL